MKKAILFLIIYFLTGLSINAQLINANILQRVFMVKYQDSISTIFTIEYNNRQYLVSAKHVFPNILEEDSIAVFHDKQWKKISVKIVGTGSKGVDIIVLATESKISPTPELVVTSPGLYLSQEVYFLGFPFMIAMEADDVNNYFPIPFVKKGILSAWIDYKEGGRKILLIDGINNQGFSGGPIVTFDIDTKKLKAIGVVSAYRTQEDKIKLGKDETIFKAITNSGILIGYSLQHAISIIEQNPIGFSIKNN